jgi:predicted amidophosphoribosyltransferase
MISIKAIGKKGFAYSVYILKSVHIGTKEDGREEFNNTYSEMGRHLHKLKYEQDLTQLKPIVELLKQDKEFNDFIKPIDIILSVSPTSRKRKIQPVSEVASLIAKDFKKKLYDDVVISNLKTQIKSLDDKNKKYELLKESISINIDSIKDKSKAILIIDDFFKSGSTLKAITEKLKENGFVNVSVFTLVKNKNAN